MADTAGDPDNDSQITLTACSDTVSTVDKKEENTANPSTVTIRKEAEHKKTDGNKTMSPTELIIDASVINTAGDPDNDSQTTLTACSDTVSTVDKKEENIVNPGTVTTGKKAEHQKTDSNKTISPTELIIINASVNINTAGNPDNDSQILTACSDTVSTVERKEEYIANPGTVTTIKEAEQKKTDSNKTISPTELIIIDASIINTAGGPDNDSQITLTACSDTVSTFDKKEGNTATPNTVTTRKEAEHKETDGNQTISPTELINDVSVIIASEKNNDTLSLDDTTDKIVCHATSNETKIKTQDDNETKHNEAESNNKNITENMSLSNDQIDTQEAIVRNDDQPKITDHKVCADSAEENTTNLKMGITKMHSETNDNKNISQEKLKHTDATTLKESNEEVVCHEINLKLQNDDTDSQDSQAVSETQHNEVDSNNHISMEEIYLSGDEVDIHATIKTFHKEIKNNIANETLSKDNVNNESKPSDNKQNTLEKNTQNDNSVNDETEKHKTEYINSLRYNYKNSVQALLKLLGFEPIESHYRRKILKDILKEKAKNRTLNLFFDPENEKKVEECETIYTSNWPTWMRPFHVKLMLELLTNIYEDKGIFYAEILTYSDVTKKQGAFLVHFTNNKECMKVFKQLKEVNYHNPHIKVELDIDNKITNTVCETSAIGNRLPKDKWLDPNLLPQYRFRTAPTSIDAPDNYKPDPFPSEHCLRLNPDDSSHKAAIMYILRRLNLKYSPIEKNKEIIKRRSGNIQWTLNDPELLKCKGIFIKNCPTWFEAQHFVYVLELFTDDFDWHYGDYFMELLQYSNGTNMGAALIRFKDQDTCQKIFKQLQRIHLLTNNANIKVELDRYEEIASQIKAGEPKGIWQTKFVLSPVFRNRYSVTYIKMPDTYKEDKYPKENTLYDTPENMDDDDEESCKIHDVPMEESIEIPSDDEECAIIENSDDSDDAISIDSNETETEYKERLKKHKANSKIVYLRNIASTKSDNYLNLVKDMIKTNTTFNPDEKYFFIKMPKTDTTPMDECYLKFLNHDNAVAVATGLDGITFRGKQIEASLYAGNKKLDKLSWIASSQAAKRKFGNDEDESTKSKRSRFERGYVNAGTSYMQFDARAKETYGLNSFYLRNIGLGNKPLTNFVAVTNLYENATESKLQEVFSLAGEIRKISLDNKNNKAIIQYDHPVEAAQAVSMLNKQKLYDKEMTVTLDHTINPKALPEGLSGLNSGFGKNGEALKGVRANRELRAIFELFEKIGVLEKVYKNRDPFLVHYRLAETANIKIGSGKDTKQTNAKPDVDTAIEALGTVLVALELISPTTDCKNLISIVDALKNNPKVNNRFKKYYNNNNTFRGSNQNTRNKFQTREGNNYRFNQDTGSGYSITYRQMQDSGPSQPQTLHLPANANPNMVEALQQILSNMMQNTTNMSNNSPNSQFTGLNFTTTATNNTAQNHPNFNLNNPNIARVMPNMNTNINPGLPLINPGINIVHPGMPIVNAGIPNVNLGIPNIGTGIPNVHPGMANVNPPGMLNVNPGGPYRNQGVPNVNPGMPSMDASIQNARPGFQDVRPGMLNQSQSSHQTPGTKINPKPILVWDSAPNFSSSSDNSPANNETMKKEIYSNRTFDDDRSLNWNQNRNTSQYEKPQWDKDRENAGDFDEDRTQFIDKSTNKEQRNRSLYPWDENFKDESYDKDYKQYDMIEFSKLPSSVTKYLLTKKIEEVGEVLFAEMTGAGRALVRFKWAQDAERCQRILYKNYLENNYNTTITINNNNL